MEEKERYEFGQRTLFNNREELTTFDGFNLDDFMQIICKLLNQQDKENKQLKQQFADLEAKLAECEKSKESYRLQNEQHHLQLLQFYSRLGVEAFGADIHEKALETLMIMKEQLADEKNTNAELVSLIDTMRYEDPKINELERQLHDLPNKIVEEIRKWGQKHYNWVGDGTGYDGQDYNECIGFNMAIDQLNEILDTILKKYGVENE